MTTKKKTVLKIGKPLDEKRSRLLWTSAAKVKVETALRLLIEAQGNLTAAGFKPGAIEGSIETTRKTLAIIEIILRRVP